MAESDQKWMKMALEIAETGVGKTDFAPSIGCVLVKNDMVIGMGRTSDGGVPHAEDNALTNAKKQGHDPAGSTAYVTLEPCATPDPGARKDCSTLLIEAGITRVVAAVQDPDHKTNGKGITRLQEHNIDVETGLCAEESISQNTWFYESRKLQLF